MKASISEIKGKLKTLRFLLTFLLHMWSQQKQQQLQNDNEVFDNNRVLRNLIFIS